MVVVLVAVVAAAAAVAAVAGVAYVVVPVSVIFYSLVFHLYLLPFCHT